MGEYRDGVLEPRLIHLIQISLCAATGSLEDLGAAIREALSEKVRQSEIREAILETYLFAGYPRAINALAALQKESEGMDSDTATASSEEASLSEDPESLEERGLRLMDLIYGRSLPSLLSNMKALDPDLARWIVREGYGKVLARPGLDVKARELCVVAILRVMDSVPQLEAHMKGAMNAGAGREEIDGALALALRKMISR